MVVVRNKLINGAGIFYALLKDFRKNIANFSSQEIAYF
jgi:hypothetical protein